MNTTDITTLVRQDKALLRQLAAAVQHYQLERRLLEGETSWSGIAYRAQAVAQAAGKVEVLREMAAATRLGATAPDLVEQAFEGDDSNLW